jgi:hypothetical protein
VVDDVLNDSPLKFLLFNTKFIAGVWSVSVVDTNLMMSREGYFITSLNNFL